MTTKVYINGSIAAPDQARISVFDRGFLYGDSVYEVLRTAGGNLVDLDRHLDRLERSAVSLALRTPKQQVIRDAVDDTLVSAKNNESYVRIVLTRGEGDVGLEMSSAREPTLIVIVKPLVLPTSDMYRAGVRVRLVNVQRTSARAVDPAVKSGNYLNNILALAEARESGDYEAVMCDREGWIAEGASSNIFVRCDDRLVLSTPSLSIGLLAGITRRRVMDLSATLNIEIEEGRLRRQDLRDAKEAFLTSSIRGILPISNVDGVAVDGGAPVAAPGTATHMVMRAYTQFLRAISSP